MRRQLGTRLSAPRYLLDFGLCCEDNALWLTALVGRCSSVTQTGCGALPDGGLRGDDPLLAPLLVRAGCGFSFVTIIKSVIPHCQ